MASTIAAITTGTGGVVTTADATGNLNLLAGTTTVVALTTAGAAVTGTLSATGITTVAAGSAALPAIVSTTGTADTGLWFPAADTVAASTAGTERLRIDSSGNVGIGTSSPSYKLNVVSTSASGVNTGVFSNANNSLFIRNGSVTTVYLTSDSSVNNAWGMDSTSNYVAAYTGNGTERMRIDSSGNVLVTNVAGLGYGTGAGGSVTQATSKATAVTLNKPCGTITLAADALASNTTARFSFNNSILAITDTVILIIRNGVTAGAYLVWVDGTAAGSCTLAIRNISAGSLSDAVALNFSIIKGVTA
jgi:hypothetical protein